MLVPKLRFKREDGTDYPEWEEKPIGMYAKIFDGVHQTPNYIESGIPFVSVEDIETLDNPTKYISVEDYERDFKTKPIKGDILMTRIGDVGRTAIVPCNGYAYYVSLALFKPFDSVNNNFLCQAMRSNFFQQELWEHTIHTAFPKKINVGDIQYCKIEIPADIEEQQKIADFLSTIDEVIAQSEAEVQNLEQQKKAAMQKIFSQEVRFKREDGTDYPEWEEKTVAEIFKITRGYVLSTKLVKSFADNEYCYPVFSSQTKDNGLMGYYNEYLYENAITWTTDGANAGTVRFRKGKFYCTNVCGVLLNETGFANQCIAEYLNSVAFKYVSYVGNPKLMNNIMAEIPIIIPCLEEQQKISDLLSAYDEAINYAKQELDKWKELKKGLLQQMFV